MAAARLLRDSPARSLARRDSVSLFLTPSTTAFRLWRPPGLDGATSPRAGATLVPPLRNSACRVTERAEPSSSLPEAQSSAQTPRRLHSLCPSASQSTVIPPDGPRRFGLREGAAGVSTTFARVHRGAEQVTRLGGRSHQPSLRRGGGHCGGGRRDGGGRRPRRSLGADGGRGAPARARGPSWGGGGGSGAGLGGREADSAETLPAAARLGARRAVASKCAN